MTNEFPKNPGDYLDAFAQEFANNQRQTEAAVMHFGGLNEQCKRLGVSVDETATSTIITLSRALGGMELDDTPETTEELKQIVFKLMAHEESPLIIEAFIRHTGAPRITNEDAATLDQAILEKQEKEGRCAAIALELYEQVEKQLGVDLSELLTDPKFRELRFFLDTVIATCHALRYETSPEDIDIKRANYVEDAIRFINGMKLDQSLYTVISELFSK